MDIFKKVKAGDPVEFQAETHNAMIDAALATRNMQVAHDPSKPGRAFYVLVQNMTDDQLDQYAILGIDGPCVSPKKDKFNYENVPILKGVKPDETQHAEKFVVLQEPLGKNQIGRACVLGVTPVKLQIDNAGTDAQAKAMVSSNETKHLIKGSGRGATLLWSENGTGEKWALILLGGGSAPGDQYAIVEEEIGRPDDLSASPPSNMGKIRIIGKKYENNQYDDCGCLELCETEKLWDEQVKYIGPFSYEESAPGNETVRKTYYLAVETTGVYYTKLDEELTYDGESKVTVTRRGNDKTFTVHNGVLMRGQKYEKDDPVTVARAGDKLTVIDGNCPASDEDEEEES